MRFNKKNIKKRFEEFNELYFNGELVEPDFVITGSRNIAGMFNCKVMLDDDDNGEEYATELKEIRIYLSKYLIRNKRIFDNILLHEMIHYYGYYSNEDINGEHEDFFMNMAEKINCDGYQITEYYED